MILLSCCLGIDVYARQIYAYQLSQSGCQPSNFVDSKSKIVCKFTYTIDRAYNTSNQLWIKATEDMFTPSEDGRLKFSFNNSEVQGFLSINDRQVLSLSTKPQKLNIDDVLQHRPLKLELEYHLDASHVGKYQIPAMMPLEFSLHHSAANDHQVFLSGLEVVQPALCSFEKTAQTIQLDSIKTNDIDQYGDSRLAGNFHLDINCNNNNVDVQMAFKDALKNDNTSDILTTQQGLGWATGVGLQFKHRDGQPVFFSPKPASLNNPSDSQWKVNSNGRNYQSNFDVYYVNTGGVGAVTAGRVQGNIIATIAYK